MGQIFGENRPILVPLMPLFCIRHLPTASVSFRYLPTDSVSGRIWPAWMMAKCLGARMTMSGGNILTPNREWAKFAERESADSSSAYAIFLLPPASAICCRVPFRVASGPRG